MLPHTRSTVHAAIATVPLLVGLIFIGLGAASPAGANFVALGQDPAGDSADPHPGRDIVKVGLSYNRRTGHLRGGVMLRGTPSGEAPANLTVFAGHRTATGCNGYPAIGFGTQTDMTSADWVLLRSSGSGPVTGYANKLYAAQAEEFEATARTLAGKRPDCVIAQLNEPHDSANVFDVAGPYNLRALPELVARLGKLPPKMKPGRTRKVRVVLRNPGDASTGRIRLSVKRARGMKVRAPRRVAAIGAGKSRKVTLRVTLNRRAATFTNLRVTAIAKQGLRAGDRGRLFLSKKKRPQKNKGSSNNSGTKLCFRFHWLPPYSQLVPC
ncbi:MAG: NEW3 domain-containing protein [Actinomycetota bacterium]|nr:NEW3 domain-containing protein [Actinomycetota bacterium]